MAKFSPTDYEQELIRFCAGHYRETSEVLTLEECPRYEEVGRRTVADAMARLERFDFVQLHVPNTFVILPAALNQVEEWDNPPLPDYRDKLTKWFWSKPWSIVVYILLVGLPALVGYVVMLKGLVEYFTGRGM